MIRILQIWHLSLLALVPVLFAIFQLVSEPYDPSRVLVDNLIFLGGGLLASYTLVFFILTGRKEDALPNLLRIYRQALGYVSFVAVSNIVLTALLIILVHQLTFYRQVEFLSSKDVEIFLNDELGKNQRLGFVRARTPTYFRLSIGKHLIGITDLEEQRLAGSELLNVQSIFSQHRPISTWIKPRRNKFENPN